MDTNVTYNTASSSAMSGPSDDRHQVALHILEYDDHTYTEINPTTPKLGHSLSSLYLQKYWDSPTFFAHSRPSIFVGNQNHDCSIFSVTCRNIQGAFKIVNTICNLHIKPHRMKTTDARSLADFVKSMMLSICRVLLWHPRHNKMEMIKRKNLVTLVDGVKEREEKEANLSVSRSSIN